jgi:carboxy-cis,cis-muconate cyclase
MLHHLMVGTWTPPGAIFTFEFDDEQLTLNLIKRTPIPENEPISWMTFDVSPFRGSKISADPHTCQHAKKNLYGAAMKKWSSFAVKSPTEIIHQASHPMEHERMLSNIQPS